MSGSGADDEAVRGALDGDDDDGALATLEGEVDASVSTADDRPHPSHPAIAKATMTTGAQARTEARI